MKARGSAAVVVVLAASSCGMGSRSEVVTNNSGVLDCPSDTIEYADFDRSFEAPGSATPSGAFESLSPDLGLPPGTPAVEVKGPTSAVCLFTDSEGNRRGRVFVSKPETGWFIERTERCG